MSGHGAAVQDGVLDLAGVLAAEDLEVAAVAPCFVPAVGDEPVVFAVFIAVAWEEKGGSLQLVNIAMKCVKERVPSSRTRRETISRPKMSRNE